MSGSARALFAVVALAVCLTSAGTPAHAEMPESPAAVAETPDSSSAMTTEELVTMADEVAVEVAELRGWEFKTAVPKFVRSEDELKAYMIKTFKEDYPGDMLDRIGTSLSLVGLLPADADLLDMTMEILMNQVGGFYDPPTRAFYMVNRDDLALAPSITKMMVAHELTHALDDQYVSLESLIDLENRTEDGEFAAAAIIEGSATTLMTRYLTRMQMAGEFGLAELSQHMEVEMERSKPMLEAPLYFQKIIAHYTLGMWFLLRNDMGLLMSPDAGKTVGERFLAAAADPPQSSEQILHPEKYWEEAERDLPVLVDDAAVEEVLAGMDLRVRHRETFGELLINMLVQPGLDPLQMLNAVNASAWTDTAARGWGGDRFYLLTSSQPRDGGYGRRADDDRIRPLDRASGLWITAWDTTTDMLEFVAAYEAARPEDGGRQVQLGDRTTAIIIGMEDDDADALARALASAPPTYTQDGANWAP